MNFDFWFYLIACGITLAVAGTVFFFMEYLTLKFFAPVVAFVMLLVGPLVFSLGTNIAKTDLTNYNEWWSGLEQRAWVDEITCTRDGRCKHTYDCDSYVVPVTKTRTVSDGKGGTTTETYTELETRWHSCPYVEKEYSYFVSDTMGETYSFGSHLFPADPKNLVWEKRSVRLPHVASGVPVAWAAAKQRIDSGNPGGTTARHTYTNYVLAAQETVYRKYSDHIEDYAKKGLLPLPASSFSGAPYFADKVYFVGNPSVKQEGWQTELQRFNGYFGSERQGDLHLVIVNADEVTDGNSFNNALEAYWQSKELGKNTLSKNGVVLILGVSHGHIKWSNGFTGMPEGNEAVLQAFRSFAGELPSATNFFSKTGDLHSFLMDAPGYKRVEMKNYKYLEDSIKPGLGAHIIMIFITVLASLSAIIFGYVRLLDEKFSESRYTASRYYTSPAWGNKNSRSKQFKTKKYKSSRLY